MEKFFPGVLYATLAAVPGWIVGVYAASPRRLRQPLRRHLSTILGEMPFAYMLYTGVTLTYGTAAWYMLRLVGALGLLTLVAAALVPVIAWTIYRQRGDETTWGWLAIVLATGIPSLCIGVTLWWFTVWHPA